MSGKIRVGVLGATGMVGQRFIQLMDGHPYFEVVAVGASPRSAGKTYAEAVAGAWKMTTPIPAAVAAMIVATCDAAHFVDCRLIFSGLDASVAGAIETAHAAAGRYVISNSKNHRRDPLVPLVVPTVNAAHLAVVAQQQQRRATPGWIVTNANCSTTAMVVPLKALQAAFGPLRRVMVTTLQAISGGGYPGVPSMDILGNVVPYISGEEEKIEWETGKILGGVETAAAAAGDDGDASAFVHDPVRVSATCTRVPVVDGHTCCVSVEFACDTPPSLAAVAQAFRDYRFDGQDLALPTKPQHAIVVTDDPARPQPRLDVDAGNGQSVTVGRIRECSLFHVKFVALCHNTILGAAGSSLLNAEIMKERGLLGRA